MSSKLGSRATVILALCSFAIASLPACTKFPYNDLLFLSSYPVAEQFCSQHFPVPTATAMTTIATLYPRWGDHRREARAPKTTAPTVNAVKTTPTPTGACTGACAVFASCTKQGGNLLATLCSCIEKQPTVTITITPTPTASTCSNTGNLNTHDGTPCTLVRNGDPHACCFNTLGNENIFCYVEPGETAGYCGIFGVGAGFKCGPSVPCINGQPCQSVTGSTDMLGPYSTCSN